MKEGVSRCYFVSPSIRISILQTDIQARRSFYKSVAEADILDAGYDLFATVLKVGHHGSDTSTSYPFLREIMPKYAIISVGRDNEYGHPTDNTLSRLRDADVVVLRIDLHGSIVCISDSKDVTFETEKKPAGMQ